MEKEIYLKNNEYASYSDIYGLGEEQ